MTQVQDIDSKNIPVAYFSHGTFSVIAGTFLIQNRLNIYKEKRRKIRQSTINSLHLPQNMITLKTAAKNFIDNRMP